MSEAIIAHIGGKYDDHFQGTVLTARVYTKGHPHYGRTDNFVNGDIVKMSYDDWHPFRKQIHYIRHGLHVCTKFVDNHPCHGKVLCFDQDEADDCETPETTYEPFDPKRHGWCDLKDKETKRWTQREDNRLHAAAARFKMTGFVVMKGVGSTLNSCSTDIRHRFYGMINHFLSHYVPRVFAFYEVLEYLFLIKANYQNSIGWSKGALTIIYDSDCAYGLLKREADENAASLIQEEELAKKPDVPKEKPAKPRKRTKMEKKLRAEQLREVKREAAEKKKLDDARNAATDAMKTSLTIAEGEVIHGNVKAALTRVAASMERHGELCDAEVKKLINELRSEWRKMIIREATSAATTTTQQAVAYELASVAQEALIAETAETAVHELASDLFLVPQTLADVGDDLTKKSTHGAIDDPEKESSIGGQTTCIVCMVGLKSHLAVPCGHQSVCADCSVELKQCPYCRAPVQLWVQARVV